MNKEAIKLYKTKYPVIKVLFSDGITKEYDVTKYAPENKEYKMLENPNFFRKAKLWVPYTIQFSDEVDIDANTIYEEGKIVPSESNVFQIMVGYEIRVARLSKHLTQAELSNLTKITQCDISKIEKGLLNPSLKIIKRITDALGKEIKITITPRIKY